jgi:membrane protein implicated in regulation of membrane protease activity
MDALLGRRATVTQEIKPGELGRARIDGDNWQVRAPGIHTTITRGEEVIVNSYDSIILNVSRPTPNS